MPQHVLPKHLKILFLTLTKPTTEVFSFHSGIEISYRVNRKDRALNKNTRSQKGCLAAGKQSQFNSDVPTNDTQRTFKWICLTSK